MLDTLKQSTRAYAFFDIARLILNKPERHLVKLAGKPAANCTRAPLWMVLPSENPFLTRDEAIRLLLRRHANLLWKQIETPIDPPKGNFTFVNRCGITGELLGPPNYHEYQTRLVRHWKEQLSDMPFDRFKARVETSKAPETIKKWLDQMSSKTEYECRCCVPAPSEVAPTATPPPAIAAAAPVEPASDASEAATSASPEQPTPQTQPPPPAHEPAAAPRFATREEVEKHILANHLDKFITTATELQISGPASRRITHDAIHEAVRQAWETEYGFPLKTATSFQMRLRQDGFHFFKDRKGITYISRIRLKRFEAGQTLTENIQKIVSFLRAHEGTTRKKLLAALAPTVEAAPATGPTPGTGPVPPPEEEQILRDLHWLIADGFVVELFNGRLWMPPEKQLPLSPATGVQPVTAPASPEAPPAVPTDGVALVSPQETAASPADAIPPESSSPAPTTESSPTSS